MRSSPLGSEKRPAARGELADRYWLVWVAAGFSAGSMITHVLV